MRYQYPEKVDVVVALPGQGPVIYPEAGVVEVTIGGELVLEDAEENLMVIYAHRAWSSVRPLTPPEQ